MSFGQEIKNINPRPTHIIIGQTSPNANRMGWRKTEVIFVLVTEVEGVKYAQILSGPRNEWTEPCKEIYHGIRHDVTPLPEDYFSNRRCHNCDTVMLDTDKLGLRCPNAEGLPKETEALANYFCVPNQTQVPEDKQ